MFFTFTPYAILLFLVSLTAVILISITLKKKDEPGGGALLGVLLSIMVWSFFSAISAGLSAITFKIIATKLSYFGIVSLPVIILIFAIYYTSNERLLNPIRIFSLWFIPILSLFLILTNEQHNLMLTGIAYRSSDFGNALVFERGFGFWVLLFYSYSCILFTLFLIAWTAYRFRYIYQKNMAVLLTMIPFSLFTNILYTFDVFPDWRGYDPTPFSLIFFASLMVWSFRNNKFFDLSPVGREVVIEQMRALLLILDHQNRVVDFNHPVQDILSKLHDSPKLIERKSFIGHPASEVFKDWPEFVHFLSIQISQTEIELCLHDMRTVFEVQKKSLENRDSKFQGWLIFLYDLTDRVQIVEAEIRTRRIAQSLGEIAMVVNSALDPHKTLNLALEQIENVIKYDFANISLLVGDEMVMEFMRGYEDPKAIQGLKIPLENSPNEKTLIHRHPVMFSDLQKQFPKFCNKPYEKVESLLCIPMYAKDEVLGFLTLASEKKNYFSNEDLTIAAAFASQVAVALQNSRLYSQVNRRLEEQSIMNEIIRIGATRMDKKEFARAVTDQIHRFIRTPGVLVAENDPECESWFFVDLYDVLEYKVDNIYTHQDGLTGYILQHGKALFLTTEAEVVQFLSKTNRENIGPVPKTFVGVPMIIKDRIIGAIVAHDLEHEKAFDEESYELFKTITSQAAIGFENVRLITQLEYLAKTDALTGIYNRGYFHNESKNMLNSAEGNHSTVSLIMMDVDHFKNLNDTYGHQIGDQVLQRAVDVCKSLLREKDIIGRVGGEEFSIVLPETHLADARKIAERIRSAIEEMVIYNNGYTVQTTVSLGVAALNQLDNGTLDDLIQISDQALYQAKANGRNCVYEYMN